MEWISVEDRLPEIPKDRFGVSVIAYVVDECCSAGNSVQQVMYLSDEGFGDIDFCEECCNGINPVTGKEDMFTPFEALAERVSHWMPLPPSPKEG